MKWLRLLIHKIIKRKFQVIITLTLALSLIFAMVISGGNAAGGFERSYNQRLENIYGSQHAIFFNVHQEKDKIESPLIKTMGFFDIFGKTETETSLSDIVLGSADDAALKLHCINLIEGRMPETENEAVVEKWMITKSGLNIKIGEEIELKFKMVNAEKQFVEEDSIRFKVVGVISDYSILHRGSNIEYYNALLPSVIFAESMYENNVTVCSVKLKNTDNYVDDVLYLESNVIYASACQRNSNRYENEGTMGSASAFVKTTVDSLYILIILIAIVLIFLLQFLFVYNQRNIIDISERLGMSGRQRSAFIFCMNMILAVFALIPGILIGIGLSGAFTSLLSATFEVEFVKGISTESILISFAVFILANICATLFNVSVFNGKRKAKTVNKAPARVSKIKSPYMLLSYKSIMCNTHRFVAISIAIAVCMAMACAGSVYKNQSGELQIKEEIYDFYLYTEYMDMIQGGIPFNDVSIEGLGENIQLLCDDSAVKNFSWRFVATVNILVNADDKKRNDLFADYFQYITDQVNKQVNNKYDESKEKLYGSPGLVCVDQREFEVMKGYDVYGEINIDALKSGKEVVMCVKESMLVPSEHGTNAAFIAYIENMKSYVGNEICISQISGYKNLQSVGERIDKTIRLGAVVIAPDGDTWDSNMIGYGSAFLGSYDYWKNSKLTFTVYDCYIELNDSNLVDIYEGKVKKLLNKYDNLGFASNAANRAEIKKTYFMLDAVIGGISIALLGFALLFMIINYAENVVSKKALFKQLYTIGATPDQINIIMLTEYISCVMLAVIIAVVPIGILSLYCYLVELENSAVNAILSGLVIPIVIILLLCIPIYFANKRWIKNFLRD